MIGFDFAAQCTGGHFAAAAPAGAEFSGVSIDTRTLSPGNLFVALAGARTDGHEHLGAARARGAALAMVERQVPGENAPLQLVVGNCVAALGALAAAWRRRCAPQVAAVTGTNGKTTVKEMIYAVMCRALGADAVLRTEGNLNNHLGVPLTLLRISPRHKCAIVEMGMSGPGEISALSRMSAPDVAVINNAMRGHLGPVGGLEGIARCKGEIIDGLGAAGTFVVNADDRFAKMWRKAAAGRTVLEFSALDVRAHTHVEAGADGAARVRVGDGAPFALALRVAGRHNRMNALAAACASSALGADADAICAGLSAFAGVPGRMQERPGAGGLAVIDDTYNANPDSALEALEALAEHPRPNRVFALGDMLELGGEAETLHAEVGRRAREIGAARVSVFTVGKLSRAASEAAGGTHFADKRALADAVLAMDGPNTAVLVKGSRGSAMEDVVGALLARGADR